MDFSIKVNVYLEDTDNIGIVYHANYFKYFERCQYEWRKHLDINDQLAAARRVFVLKREEASFLAPAILGDELTITLEMLNLCKASVVMAHKIYRGDELIVDGKIHLACVNADTLRLDTIPQEVADKVHTLKKGA